jgi:hypothetical protein
MTQPTVVAVCLTADRPDMTRQAVASFRAQTYPAGLRHLAILDTGKLPTFRESEINSNESYVYRPQFAGATIGELRNQVIAPAHKDSVIITLDSDDHSHEHRFAEQVALLQSSGAECVGYNEMLFWDERQYVRAMDKQEAKEYRKSEPDEYGPFTAREGITNEAWLYSRGMPALGTSLCYWRSVWERRPFPALMTGEDAEWLTGVDVKGVSSFPLHKYTPEEVFAPNEDYQPGGWDYSPRMVARIHGGNTSRSYGPGVMAACERQGDVWRRVPEWDAYCRKVFSK